MGGRVFVYLNLHATRASRRENFENSRGTINLTSQRRLGSRYFFFITSRTRGIAKERLLSSKIVRKRLQFKEMRVIKR